MKKATGKKAYWVSDRRYHAGDHIGGAYGPVFVHLSNRPVAHPCVDDWEGHLYEVAPIGRVSDRFKVKEALGKDWMEAGHITKEAIIVRYIGNNVGVSK
jgi:hypothetical protein